jgi:4-hydroxythreonine-4-phosphate dehydrogenase
MDAPQTVPRPPIALTMGDAAGIGPELGILAWRDRKLHGLSPFAIYADPNLMRSVAASLGSDLPVAAISDVRECAGMFDRALPVVPVALNQPARAGEPTPANGAATILSIKRAVADIAAKRASAIVTNPISKAVLYQAGFKHPGHTEYLGELAREFWPAEAAQPVMMLCSSELRVIPVTIHVPLKDVPTLLTTAKIVETTRVVAAALQRDFAIANPRLAITGLNPHAGEDGTMGTEDRDVIGPAIEALRRNGLNVTGPHSADTLFHAAARQRYDAAIAMYHDQALIPIKTLSFDEGVNVTLGLPFVRTSPDHGTAFGIAGKGMASAASLIAALKLAADMSARRYRAATA